MDSYKIDLKNKTPSNNSIQFLRAELPSSGSPFIRIYYSEQGQEGKSRVDPIGICREALIEPVPCCDPSVSLDLLIRAAHHPRVDREFSKLIATESAA